MSSSLFSGDTVSIVQDATDPGKILRLFRKILRLPVSAGLYLVTMLNRVPSVHAEHGADHRLKVPSLLVSKLQKRDVVGSRSMPGSSLLLRSQAPSSWTCAG
jgi:hypothetical protein